MDRNERLGIKRKQVLLIQYCFHTQLPTNRILSVRNLRKDVIPLKDEVKTVLQFRIMCFRILPYSMFSLKIKPSCLRRCIHLTWYKVYLNFFFRVRVEVSIYILSTLVHDVDYSTQLLFFGKCNQYC